MRDIRMIDLAAEYQLHRSTLEPKIVTGLQEGNYIQGKHVKLFENELAHYFGIKHVINCANGTDALQIALMALDIKPGDEVIIPAFTYIAVIEVICLLGITPVLVDVEAEFFQIDVKKIEKAITPKTKAIIPVHLFGQCGDLETIVEIAKKYQLYIIEDNAQSLGATYTIGNENKYLGSFGHISCTSFFPTKNLSCFGDGGAIFTNNDDLARKIRMIANHGQQEKYEHLVVGCNSRLDTLQAIVLNHKLSFLENALNIKITLANQYFKELAEVNEIQLPKINPLGTHSWHQFTIKVKNEKRDDLKSFLAQGGVQSMVYYPKSLAQQKAYTQYPVYSPISDELCLSVLSLPIHSLLRKEDIFDVCNLIKDFFND